MFKKIIDTRKRGTKLMNDAQLKCFLKAAEYENFTKAAEALFVTQPIVGRNISILEEELGCTLFERSRKSVKLTKNGKLFAEFVSEMFSRFESVHTIMQNNERCERMALSIGTCDGIRLGVLLAPVFNYFADNIPNTTIKINSYQNTDEQLEAIRKGEIDFGILGDDVLDEHAAFIDFRKICTAVSCIIIPKTHPLAEKDILTINDFINCRFIIRSRSDNELTFNEQLKHAKALGITDFIEVPNLTTFTDYLLAGVGISTVMNDHELCYNPNFRRVSMPELAFSFREVLVWKKGDTNPAINLFLKVFDEMERGKALDG